MTDEPVTLEEAASRAKGKAEGREELLQEQALDVERAGTRDRAFRALALSIALVTVFAAPLLAAIVGLSVRVFRWSSGW